MPSLYIPTRTPAPASLLADMLDTLAECVTEPQVRAWVSATAEFRAVLPEMLLERVEKARRGKEQQVESLMRQQIIKARVESVQRSQSCNPNERLFIHDGRIREPLLTAIRRVQRLHSLKDSTFGRAALRDGTLIRNLKNGRQLRPSTEMRLRSFIAAMEKEAGNA